jgi:hypothetical protein
VGTYENVIDHSGVAQSTVHFLQRIEREQSIGDLRLIREYDTHKTSAVQTLHLSRSIVDKQKILEPKWGARNAIDHDLAREHPIPIEKYGTLH